MPSNHFFSFFPTFKQLVLVFKKYDFDAMADQIQEDNDYIDFTIVESKYEKHHKWFFPRFLVLAFLLWVIPVLSGYILCRSLDKSR